MASMWITCCKFFLLFILISSLQLLSLASSQYEVGESEGWAIPPSDDEGFYNEWASKQRFQVGDSVVFTYKKDSVMVVTDDDYNRCNSSHPVFFSNNGNTVYELDRAGPFYFISGVSGHCKEGQKMIIKVMGHDASKSPNSPNTETNEAGPIPRIAHLLVAPQFMLLLSGFFLQF